MVRVSLDISHGAASLLEVTSAVSQRDRQTDTPLTGERVTK